MISGIFASLFLVIGILTGNVQYFIVAGLFDISCNVWLLYEKLKEKV